MIVGVDIRARRIKRKKDGAIEAVALAEDLCEHRQGFLAAIFLVPCNEHDVLAFPRTGFALEFQIGLGCERRNSGEV